ncbi:hypothetical protein SPLC1_S540090 [Arthrospira platensis C1]|nr:hypothetical protein SPLC1_S540090 [Arthrospira platensis C1]
MARNFKVISLSYNLLNLDIFGKALTHFARESLIF